LGAGAKTHHNYGLRGTEVCGPRPLVEALLADPEIEAIRLPWIR
jgi:hypothetical protein